MKKEKIMFQIKQFCSKHEGKYHCYISNDVNEVITQRSHVMVKITHRTIHYFTRIMNKYNFY